MELLEVNVRRLALIIVCIIPVMIFAQVKHFEIKPIPAPTKFSINIDHPDCGQIVVYSSLRGLIFESNMAGIKETTYSALESKYVVFLKPVRQKVVVKAIGFIEAELWGPGTPRAKDVVEYYSIEEHKSTIGKGTLIIESEPQGAEIHIEGIPLSSRITPDRFEDLMAMQYRITLKAYRYQDSTFVATVTDNQVRRINVALKPAYGSLSIQSNPSNARVFINDKVIGTTPLNLAGRENGLDAGRYLVKVSSDRFGTSEKYVVIETGKSYTETFNLEALFGGVAINSEPPGARVLIDGQFVGNTPFMAAGIRNGLAVGSHEIRIEPSTEMYLPETRTIEIFAGKTEVIDVQLRQSVGYLSVSSAVSPYEVYLDGVLHNELGRGEEITLATKEYSLRVVVSGNKAGSYKPFEQKFSLAMGEKKAISARYETNSIHLSLNSDLPYTNIRIVDLEKKSTVYNGLVVPTVELWPGTYEIVASKDKYLDYHATLTLILGDKPRFNAIMLPINALGFLDESNRLRLQGQLTVTKGAGNVNTLSWLEVAGADGYLIDRRDDDSEWNQGIVFVSADQEFWVDKEAKPTSVYRICAIKGSSRSNVVFSEGASSQDRIESTITYRDSSLPDNWNWLAMAPFPGKPRESAISFSVDKTVYYGLGIDKNMNTLNDMWMLNTVLNQWFRLKDFPGAPRYGAFAVVANNSVIVGTGRNRKFLRDVWQYHPSSDTWTQKNNFPGGGRYEAVAFAIGDRAFIGLGGTGSYLRDFWEYNAATDKWLRRTNYPGSPQRSARYAVIGNDAYVGLGFDGALKNELFYFRATDNKWYLVESMPVDLAEGMCMFPLNNHLFLGMGNKRDPGRTFIAYDPQTKQWQRSDIRLTAKTKIDPLTQILSDRILVGLGRSGSEYELDIWMHQF